MHSMLLLQTFGLLGIRIRYWIIIIVVIVVILAIAAYARGRSVY